MTAPLGKAELQPRGAKVGGRGAVSKVDERVVLPVHIPSLRIRGLGEAERG